MSQAAAVQLCMVAAKATVLLLLAGTALLAARRASAAVRHWIAFLALGAVLLLPALPLAVPALELRVLPPAAPSAAATDAPLPTGGGLRPAAIAASVWLAGVALCLTRLARAHLSARRLRRDAVPLESWSWRQVAADVGRGLGLRRRAPVLAHAGVRVPVVVGVFRPAVVVPVAAAGWTPGHRRAVLIHEMAHIRRHDCLTQLVAGLASAIYWFHPLAWWMARAMRQERELACDDLVLAQGARPSGYATLLLRLRGFMFEPRAVPAGAVAFGLRSGLKERIESLLACRSRRLLTADHHFWLASAVLAVLLPVAALRPAPAAATPVPAAVALAPEAPGATVPPPALAPAAPAPVVRAVPPAPVPVASPVVPESPDIARLVELLEGVGGARLDVHPRGFRVSFVFAAEIRVGR